MGSDYAVVIGIEYYQAQMNQLGGPHGDAENFLAWLKDNNGGNIPDSNIRSFLSDESYVPNIQEIDDWFIEIMTRLQQTGVKGRRLYFYFSGHGIGSSQTNSAMLLPKWTLTNRNYALSSEKYLQELLNKGLFSEIFFFMDCCRNRITNVTGQGPTWIAGAAADTTSDYLVFYASEFANPAYEVTFNIDNGVLDNMRPRGLFTEVLIKGLQGAAADRNGRLNVSNLVNYVKNQLPALAASQGKTQIPKSVIAFDLQKEIVGPFATSFPITIEFERPDINLVLEDAELRQVRAGNSSEGRWELILDRGEHILRKVGEDQGMRIVVDGLQNEFTYA